MNTAIRFRSPLAEAMDEFVTCKRPRGCDYTKQAQTLSCFDRFLTADGGRDEAGRLALDTLRR